MAEIASILGHSDDAAAYRSLYEKIREAYIAEYVHEDGTMDANLQGIYVITLQMGLVPDDIRPKMVDRLCEMISENGDKLDTGFLSVLFLMDVLCDNGREDVAYKLLFQTGCPSWLYEVISGGSTMWESWGAVGEDGSVSTYSYNHYAFGCVGEWMYRYIGGLSAFEPGYRKILVQPHMNCGLKSVEVSEETPYGRASVSWNIVDNHALITVTVPANTTAQIRIKGVEEQTVGSGSYCFLTQYNE
jgi:alpha-L-rhamnosidase